MIFTIVVTSALVLSLNEANPVPLQVVERVDFPSNDQDYHSPIIPIIPPTKDGNLNLDPGSKMTSLNLDPVPLTFDNSHKNEKDREFDAFLSSLQNSEDEVQDNFNPSHETNNFQKTPYVLHPVIENVNTQIKDKISNDTPLSTIQSVKESTVKESTRKLESEMSNVGISHMDHEDFPERMGTLHTSNINYNLDNFHKDDNNKFSNGDLNKENLHTNSNIEQVFGTGSKDAQHLFDNHASVDDTKTYVNKDIDKVFSFGSPSQHENKVENNNENNNENMGNQHTSEMNHNLDTFHKDGVDLHKETIHTNSNTPLFDNHEHLDDHKVNANKDDIDKIFEPGKNTDVSPVRHDTASSSLHNNSDLRDNMGTGHPVKEPSGKESVSLESKLKDVNTQEVEHKISNAEILSEATDFSEHTGTLHTSDINHNTNIDVHKEKIHTDSNIERAVFGAGPKEAQPLSDDTKPNINIADINIADIDKVFDPIRVIDPPVDKPLVNPLKQQQHQQPSENLDNVDMNPDETDAIPLRNSQSNGGGNSSFGFLKKLITSAVQSIVHGIQDLTGMGRTGCGSRESCGNRFGDVNGKNGLGYNVNEANSEAEGVNGGGRQSDFNQGMKTMNTAGGNLDETPSTINEKATSGGFTSSRGSGMESFADESNKMPGNIRPGNGGEMGYGVNSMPGGMWPVGPGPVFMPGRRPPFPPMGPGWGFRGDPYNEPNFDRNMPRNYMFRPPFNNGYYK